MKSAPNIKSYALKLLGIRDRSEGELRTKLKDKGYDPDLIDTAVAELKAVGLINDQRTAEAILRYCKDVRLLGEGGCRFYLRRRGISDGIISAIAMPPDEQLENAKILITKKERYLKKLPLKVKINRLYGQLQRKGYGYETIHKAMREYERMCGDSVELEKVDAR
ncbi:MAG: recombination regulator RecX [Candidatus Magnetominusculus sp. LBB02]|nr:recombination regulator RecX [Candidatus Magnetominusculus sp. LBB02]